MSKTYRRVTRKERKEGSKGRRSCFRPEIAYVQGEVSVVRVVRLAEEHPAGELDTYEGALSEHLYLVNLERLSEELGYETSSRRYDRTNHPAQTVPKIDWHYERWRNGRKSWRRTTTKQANDLRERTKRINAEIDFALANGRNPFRRRTRYKHSRYSWGT